MIELLDDRKITQLEYKFEIDIILGDDGQNDKDKILYRNTSEPDSNDKNFFRMLFLDFKINGTAILKFSEAMLDESRGFNISILNDGLMNLTIKLSEESKISDMLLKSNRTL